MKFQITQEFIVALAIGLAIYFSAVTSVYMVFGPPSKGKSRLNIRKRNKKGAESGNPEESVREIVKELENEKFKTSGNINDLDEEIARQEEHLRKLKEEREKKS
ncbi:hypothetical protein [Youngiibacter fragilis]|uniref:Uncharacterized protein n=1 Tax=Youngiibacter fragilis 232.1 TaxID=994573 RepID=V7I9H5_9CLOT|nr:hypothetical protein [Youngiibacter fragilis]ETA81941.1 hypothetical protein T472_0203010 [Youngiibacter fragilis 232.1]